MSTGNLFKKGGCGSSLVAYWLRFQAFTTMAQAQSLVGEHPTSRMTWPKESGGGGGCL